MARVLIAGCGYVGNRLGEMLLERNDVVFGLRRNVTGLLAGITPFAADLCDPATLVNLPNDFDFVVYAAAANDSSDAAYVAAYVTGLRNLLVALTQQDRAPKSILFTSSTGVYPTDDGSWVDESTTVDVAGRVDRVREGERMLEDSPFAATILRFGGIYGPGRTRFVESVKRGTIEYTVSPPQWTNRIHLDDCAGALAHLLRLERAERIYVGVDDEPAPKHEVVSWLANRLGTNVPPATTSSTHGSGKRCSNARLRASGYVFRFPSYREGYSAMLPHNPSETP